MSRGSRALLIVPKSEFEFTPLELGENVVFGLPSWGWLNTLNASALNSSVVFSHSLKFFIRDAFELV